MELVNICSSTCVRIGIILRLLQSFIKFLDRLQLTLEEVRCTTITQLHARLTIGTDDIETIIIWFRLAKTKWTARLMRGGGRWCRCDNLLFVSRLILCFCLLSRDGDLGFLLLLSRAMVRQRKVLYLHRLLSSTLSGCVM